MAEYIHGAYGQVKAVGVKAAAKGPAFVYFGTAPINTVEGGAKNVNIPIVIRDFSDMKNKLGYSDDWAKYTLCEAAKVHLSQKGVGPLIFINVLDTVKHKASAAGSISPERKTSSWTALRSRQRMRNRSQRSREGTM